MYKEIIILMGFVLVLVSMICYGPSIVRIWHKYSPFNLHKLRCIQKQIQNNDPETHSLLLVFQSTLKRPDNVQGGLYYPEHDIIDVTNGLTEMPENASHIKVYKFTKNEMKMANTNSYWFSVYSPSKSKLTRKEVYDTIHKLNIY